MKWGGADGIEVVCLCCLNVGALCVFGGGGHVSRCVVCLACGFCLWVV